MAKGLPSFEELRDLITSSPKPPVRAKVTERRAGGEQRRALVVHDGDKLWYIDDGDRIELNDGKSAVLVSGNGVSRTIGDLVANNWAKMLFQGRLITGLTAPPRLPGPPPPPGMTLWTLSSEGEVGLMDADRWAMAAAFRGSAQGTVLGREALRGRDCWITDVRGLSGSSPDVTFRLWVDAESGVILRLRRHDMPDWAVEVEEIQFGTTQDLSPPSGD